ncbi:MAG: hypothetical protein FWG51_00960, partial [Firmicutes bacterium]|nr:hypothetical protein [Bacillota bacterium]
DTHMGTIVGYNYPTFNTSNTNQATWSVTWDSGKDEYLFKQSNERVGRQDGVAPPGGGSCFVPGTLVTLADGTQVPVELLTGDELLLVWNFYTGTFDAAPIIFIDSDESAYVETVRLIFTRGADVTIIYEHGFWDLTLNAFVWLNAENASDYIGHEFMQHVMDNKGNMTWQSVKLVNVQIKYQQTTAWSPVTFSHFSLYIDGLLSAPASTNYFLNIFAVDASTLAYDMDAYQSDIEEFGLLSYEEFSHYLPGLPEIFFDAFNGQYLLVAMRHGLVTWDDLSMLVERYAHFFIQ